MMVLVGPTWAEERAAESVPRAALPGGLGAQTRAKDSAWLRLSRE